MRAEAIAKALSGRKAGARWIARCPAHDDREPSLSICDADHGKVLIRCHAGCDQWRVIGALRSRGLWDKNGHHQFTRAAPPGAVTNNQPDRDDAKRSEAALAIWQSATPAAGTLVETYLVSRGLHLPPPPTPHFHAGLKQPLARDGGGKAPVVPQKMMLGPCRGGAVRLGVPGDVLMIGEGIPAWPLCTRPGSRLGQRRRLPACARLIYRARCVRSSRATLHDAVRSACRPATWRLAKPRRRA